MSKKIHFILTQDLSSPGGLGRYFPWAEELVRSGFTVRISALHSNYRRLEKKKFTLNGVKVEYVSQMHVLKQGSNKLYFSLPELFVTVLRATIALSLASLKHPADIIIVGKPHPMNGIAGILGRMRWKSSLFVDIDDDEENSGNFKYIWQKKVVKWFQNRLASWANFVTTNTIYMKEKLILLGIQSHKIYYFPNGVDPSKFITPSNEDITNLRKKIGVDGKKVILFVGSISITNHPLHLLIQAFIKLRQIDPQVVLLVVGGGEDFEKVKDFIQGNNLEKEVLLLGKVPHEEVSKYYAIADVSVDPVYDDLAARGRCPLKLFESWECGVPFVTGDVGDRRLLAGKPPAIKICQPGDPDSLALSIYEVLTDNKQASSLIEQGKIQVKSYYWTHIVQKFCHDLLFPKH